VCLQLIREIVQIYKEHNLQTRVLSASIRHPTHALESAKAGAYAGTMPFKVGCEGVNSKEPQ
jgi:transaldolase